MGDRRHAPASDAIRGGQAGLGNNVERVARSLFTDFLWPFEITAVLLVLAAVGAVVLARRSRHPEDDVPVVRGRLVTPTLAALEITTNYYLVLAAMMFTIGTVGLLTRRT